MDIPILMIVLGEDEPRCDFCSGTPVVAMHQCEPAVMGEVSTGGAKFTHEDKDGLWAACAQCDLLIRGEVWSYLRIRSYAKFREHHGFFNRQVKQMIDAAQDHFIATRKKPA